MRDWKTSDWNAGSWLTWVLDENVSIVTKTPHFPLYTPSTIIILCVCIFYPQCKQGIVNMSCIYWRNLNGCIEKYCARLTIIRPAILESCWGQGSGFVAESTPVSIPALVSYCIHWRDTCVSSSTLRSHSRSLDLLVEIQVFRWHDKSSNNFTRYTYTYLVASDESNLWHLVVMKIPHGK